MKFLSNKSGMSLIEIIAATVLLTMISFFLVPTVRNTVQARTKTLLMTDINQEFRSVFNLINNDLKKSFFITPKQMGWNKVIPDDITDPKDIEEYTANLDPPLPVTIFRGEKDNLILSTQTHQRFSQDIPENKNHLVNYYVKKNNLIRGESARLISPSDVDEPENFREFVVLEKVQKFILEYWDEKLEDWTDRWDTDISDTFNRLPLMVKVYISWMPEKFEKNKDLDKEQKTQILEFTVPITQSGFIFDESKKLDQSIDDKLKQQIGSPLGSPLGTP